MDPDGPASGTAASGFDGEPESIAASTGLLPASEITDVLLSLVHADKATRQVMAAVAVARV
jgi:hypothetical protein